MKEKLLFFTLGTYFLHQQFIDVKLTLYRFLQYILYYHSYIVFFLNLPFRPVGPAIPDGPGRPGSP